MYIGEENIYLEDVSPYFHGSEWFSINVYIFTKCLCIDIYTATKKLRRKKNPKNPMV